MPVQTYTIELRIDTSEQGHEAMLTIAKQYARDLLSSSMLVSNDPQRIPSVIMRTQDSFYNTDEIEVLAPSGGQ